MPRSNRLATMVLSVLAAVGVTQASPAADAQPASDALAWGYLRGRFIYDGKAPARHKIDTTRIVRDDCYRGVTFFDESLTVTKDGGLANVVVYLRDANVKVHPDYRKTADGEVSLGVIGGRFVPHVAVARVGQPLFLYTTDPVATNFHFTSLKADVAFNVLVRAGGSPDMSLKEPLDVPGRVVSDIHRWMQGYLLSRPNPYAAVSEEDGTFRIEKLPVGEWEFQTWHERAGYLKTADWKGGRFKVQIKPGANDMGTIRLDAKLFRAEGR